MKKGHYESRTGTSKKDEEDQDKKVPLEEKRRRKTDLNGLHFVDF